MTVRVFVDSNVLIYARDLRDSRKQTKAIHWLDLLRRRKAIVVSHQVLAEYYSAASNKLKPGFSARQCRLDVALFLTWICIPPSQELYELAFDIEDRFRFSWWDCLIVAAAKRGGCTHLLTEDLQHGQDLGGLSVISPFRIAPEAVLAG